jgi:hypothetical protein
VTDLKAAGSESGPLPEPPVTRASRWIRGRTAGRLSSARSQVRRLAAEFRPRALWQRHRLITIAVVLGLIPRIFAALAFRPAEMTGDSFVYMQEAVTYRLGQIRPFGYPFFLSLFRIFPHDLLAVTTAQHLMGVAAAVIVYGMLRYWGLPGWGATLGGLPILFDTHEIALESYILPDTLFMLVLLIAACLLLTRKKPGLWQCVLVALLLAYASVLRGDGLPLIPVFAVFLLIRRVGWKPLAAAAAAVAIPVAGYATAFHAEYHHFNITESAGIFLWSRTTSFADCAIIKPPADLRPLCPNADTHVYPPHKAQRFSVTDLMHEPTPSKYLWAPEAFWRNDSHPGIDAYNNRLGERFAKLAIEKQPLDYARVVAENVLLTFTTTDRPIETSNMTFTYHPRIASLPYYYVYYIDDYAHTTSNSRAVKPYSYFVLIYQDSVYFPGVLFLLIILGGLGFVLRDWRRLGGMQLLPWAVAATLIVLPAMLTQSLLRYTIAAIPVACLAVGIGFASRRGAGAELAARAAWRRRQAVAAGPAADQAADVSSPLPAPRVSGEQADQARNTTS